MKFANETLLVTGANGQLGRAIVDELVSKGAKRVIAATRDPSKVKAPGVEARAADFDRPETLAAAFEGVGRLVLISTDSLGAAGQRLAQHRAAIAAAIKAGVKHVVYTSAPSPGPSEQSAMITDHFWTEAALFASGLDWTILRNNLYADIIPRVAGNAIKTGKLFAATAGRGRSYVTREDCARTAAGVLLQAEGRAIHDVTGPAAITQDELAALLAALTGRPVAHVDLPPEALKDGMLKAGMPLFYADGLVSFDVAAARGYHAVVTPTVERFSGRKPTSVAEYLAANKASLVAAA
jgi:NAD(P)H dehydrogenase (quinone)